MHGPASPASPSSLRGQVRPSSTRHPHGAIDDRLPEEVPLMASNPLEQRIRQLVTDRGALGTPLSTDVKVEQRPPLNWLPTGVELGDPIGAPVRLLQWRGPKRWCR